MFVIAKSLTIATNTDSIIYIIERQNHRDEIYHAAYENSYAQKYIFEKFDI